MKGEKERRERKGQREGGREGGREEEGKELKRRLYPLEVLSTSLPVYVREKRMDRVASSAR